MNNIIDFINHADEIVHSNSVEITMNNDAVVNSDINLLPNEFNALGESPLQGAPSVELANGHTAIPQQFFHYSRSQKNIEEVVSQIQFSSKLPIFVYEENGHCFLQVGIIGHENYPPLKQGQKINRNDKIVYGRKWFIEPHCPTSEVIQTAFLALQKVREHELREFFTLTIEKNHKTYKSTPFNTHMDLPLMASNAGLFHQKNTKKQINEPKNAITQNELTRFIKTQLSAFSFGGSAIVLKKLTHIEDNTWHLSFIIEKLHSPFKQFFPEFNQTIVSFSIVLNPDLSDNQLSAYFLHSLFESMLAISYRHLCEHFTYQGFARFSQHISPVDIANFSIDTRILKQPRTQAFNQAFKAMSAHVDGGKAPKMATGEHLRQLQQHSLNTSHFMEGYLPRES